MQTSAERFMSAGEKMKGFRTAMLVSMDSQGALHSRPMAVQDVEFDGDLWFITSNTTEKYQELQRNPNVNVAFGDSSIKFVSASGKAVFVDDKQKIHEVWNDFYKAWFKDEHDPTIALFKVEVDRVEYWDHAGGKLGAYIDMAASAVTGKAMDDGEHGVITLAS